MARLANKREIEQLNRELYASNLAGLIKSWFPDISNERAMRWAGFSRYRAKKLANKIDKEMAKR